MSTAPKVTIEDVEASIKKEEYVLLPDGRTTICLLTLDNGFTIRGESSCVCIENYNEEDGHKYSRAAAVSKVWPFLGFRLADRVSKVPEGMLGEQYVYVGTKAVIAKPMSRQEYNDYRGWTLPEDENGDDLGFLVEYLDGGQANDKRHVGYISWSPAEVFLRSYHKI